MTSRLELLSHQEIHDKRKEEEGAGVSMLVLSSVFFSVGCFFQMSAALMIDCEAEEAEVEVSKDRWMGRHRAGIWISLGVCQ